MKLILRKLIFYFLFKTQNTEEKIDFCNINTDHLLCNISTQADVVAGLQLHYPKDKKEREIILDEFNKMRNAIARGDYVREGIRIPGATNLLQLEWCDECEGAAWKNIKDCTSPIPEKLFPMCCNCLNSGELLMIPLHIEEPNKNLFPDFNINFFLNKSVYFAKETIGKVDVHCIDQVTENCVRDHPLMIPVSHSKLTHIGCAYVRCPESMKTNHFLCYMGSLFDVLNEELYKKGKSCSGCPPGVKCSTKYPHLCECKPMKKCQPKFPDPSSSCRPGEMIPEFDTNIPSWEPSKNKTDENDTEVPNNYIPFLVLPKLRVTIDDFEAQKKLNNATTSKPKTTGTERNKTKGNKSEGKGTETSRASFISLIHLEKCAIIILLFYLSYQ
ncbi:UNVERIFIED_CONTAM: hypothetical protein RMT77_007424 [Armadillidium vulgare]